MISAALPTAILFVNFVVPKKMFKTMNECDMFKHNIEQQMSSHYDPVNLFHRMPTLSCVPKPVPKPKQIKPIKINKPIKVPKLTKPIKLRKAVTHSKKTITKHTTHKK